MTDLTISNFSDLVMMAGDRIVTDSRRVARHFGKRHDNVLRAYDRIECSKEFNQLNFEAVEYMDAKGELRRMIRMTKDGFMFMVMGFTGKKAAQTKESFIVAFNAMADHIRRQSASAWQEYRAAAIEFEKGRDTASLCGKGLRRWRTIKHALEDRLDRLECEVQPALFLN
ncbi:Rha family transcriptional regulator [Paludibacterium purpuratum]|uniref:Rha family phage regulatory protein n=1 Tax=Paludibacterium purpuratum TaxID=1144873 RepID=A0A4V3DVU0_9NEIS|nr:Rha family transcriptional regulator [Paludibacterium purpuratum]TDR82209.1 Rha family phage regulatory protein [Paludibacterium purpuratum]